MFDRKEQVMRKGMGVKATRMVWKRKRIPEFMGDNKAVADFLRRRSPLANTPCKYPDRGVSRGTCSCRPCRETMKAGRWAVVIRDWFLGFKSDSTIESGRNWKPGTVGYIVQQIRRAIAGERLDGIPRTGKKRGRPRNTANVPPNEELVVQNQGSAEISANGSEPLATLSKVA